MLNGTLASLDTQDGAVVLREARLLLWPKPRDGSANQVYTVGNGYSVQPDQDCSNSSDHIDEDTLELYALGRLTDEGQIAVTQKHLLSCEGCRKRSRTENEFVRLLRAALRRV